jgi:hypothetical protein
MTFQPGQSGNPAGRPKGARGKAALFREGLLDGEAEEIIRAAVEMAKGRDIAAIRLCLDRVLPRPRDRATPFELPPLHSAASALSALADVAAAVSSGDLTPVEAESVSKLLDCYLRMLDCVQFEERLAALEHATGVSATKNNQNSRNSQQGSHGAKGDGQSGQDGQASQTTQRGKLDPDSPYNFGDAP